MPTPTLIQLVEALLFSSNRSLKPDQIANALEIKGTQEVRQCLRELQEFYEAHQRPYFLQEVAGGFLITTRKEYAPYLTRAKVQKPVSLSPSVMEALSIIAYKQPITRAELDEIRGVDSSYAVRALLDKGLLRIAGKKEIPGRPMLYGTSRLFLEVFGFKNLGELPRPEDFDLYDQNQAVGPEAEELSQQELEERKLLALQEAALAEEDPASPITVDTPQEGDET